MLAVELTLLFPGLSCSLTTLFKIPKDIFPLEAVNAIMHLPDESAQKQVNVKFSSVA